MSACIQGIMAAEIGYMDEAMECGRYAVLMDLADVGHNVSDGCHIASMGGTWMVLVYGLAGMRDVDGQLTFRPRLPGELKNIRFPLTIRGQTLEVAIDRDKATYTLREGTELVINHFEDEIMLVPGEPVVKTLNHDT
ncbi:MAG: glycosyl hydrolase family 65 protein [Acidimicrobiia bacterium]|nr:glycosyl hydrolase family 65 protein [Acidimicrobiia bacterium]